MQITLAKLWFDGERLRRPGEVVEIEGPVPVDLAAPGSVQQAEPELKAPAARTRQRATKAKAKADSLGPD